MTMAAARRPTRDADPAPLSVRLTAEGMRSLDAWLAEQNERREFPLTRTDLLRGLISWAARTKPEWEEGQHVLLVVDGDGDVVLRKPVRSISGGEITFADALGRDRKATFAMTKVEGGQVVTYYLTDTIDDLPSAGAPRGGHHLVEMKRRQDEASRKKG